MDIETITLDYGIYLINWFFHFFIHFTILVFILQQIT